ncbi:hypothetical protein ACFWP2_36335 [Kitasatospora sp. NPDC058444]|uniref:hypothetical protein n=1 Tax=Kitasatospora sp. NPDC058444 TaxID=3346504 RepID=UPI00364FC7AD
MRAATAVVLLAVTAGCGGGSSSGETPAPTGSSASDPSAISTLFPGSKGGSPAAKAMLPSTPLGGQSDKSIALGTHSAPPESNTVTGVEAATSTGTGTTIGAVHLSTGSYSVADNPCTGRTLQPGDTCVITIAFSPTTVGTHTAELTVDTSAADADYRVELIGEGVEPGSPSPSSSSKSPTPVTTPSPRTTSSAEAPSPEVTES